MNVAKGPRPFHFRSSIARWMASACLVPNIFRQLFVRKYHQLLVARNMEKDRRSLQVAMEVLLRHHRDPPRANEYLKGICAAITTELHVVAEYVNLKDGEGNWECPGVVDGDDE